MSAGQDARERLADYLAVTPAHQIEIDKLRARVAEVEEQLSHSDAAWRDLREIVGADRHGLPLRMRWMTEKLRAVQEAAREYMARHGDGLSANSLIDAACATIADEPEVL